MITHVVFFAASIQPRTHVGIFTGNLIGDRALLHVIQGILVLLPTRKHDPHFGHTLASSGLQMSSLSCYQDYCSGQSQGDTPR